MRTRTLLSLLAVLAATALAAGCGGQSKASGASGSKKLTLVAYSTPKEAYAELIPAFQKTAAGKGIAFDQSYGASGDQERAVEGGLPADVVALSLAPDVNKLVKAGLVDANWDKAKYGGFVTNSVVTLAVRKGNPRHIHTWSDLVKPGVQVITPNPFTSGGAKWNVMAAYGAQLQQGKSPAQALDYLKKLLKNVPVLDKSAREALQTFSSGKGDVLISYENEAITAQQKGEKLDYVTPSDTLLIQNPDAVVKKSNNLKAANAFLTYLRSDPAQKIFAAKGYRSVNPKLVDAKKYPKPKGLFTIDKLGGWSAVNDKFFDPNTGEIAKVFQSEGKSTGG
ncbi:MAG TPA: sulfate ABC transporter substrate-binding protein [Thermoleophilaceae bacterium]|nr:sulfate ABC transporter substrate-binding protein [Thermoleophilaceae bacterium]